MALYRVTETSDTQSKLALNSTLFFSLIPFPSRSKKPEKKEMSTIMTLLLLLCVGWVHAAIVDTISGNTIFPLGSPSFTPLSKSAVVSKKGQNIALSIHEMDSLIHHDGPVFPHDWAFKPEFANAYSPQQFQDMARRTHHLMSTNRKLAQVFSHTMESALVHFSPESHAKREQFRDTNGEYHVAAHNMHLLNDFEGDTAYHSAHPDNDEGDNNDDDNINSGLRLRRPYIPKCSEFLPGYDDTNPKLWCNQRRRRMIRGKPIFWVRFSFDVVCVCVCMNE